ncbi:MAG: zinc dependent phospholipase C family protein [Polyangiaceae bacterium]|nr:zinc dependent phospholipase C family protein [Polyangiaceae bacterium]
MSAAAACVATSTLAPEAFATGMQGHVYMAQCAAEQIQDARLRAIFEAHPTHLANGGFFPDSGYTAKDHDQGEIPHWEGYVQAYVELIRETYGPKYDSPEAGEHIAFLMGMAAHGITDSTYDAIFGDRAAQVEPTDINSLDMANEIFLVHDLPRYYIPDIVVDTNTHSNVFTNRMKHPVTAESIADAMSTARSGIAVVANLLYVGADEWGGKYPWARKHLLDPRVPGAYPFGAKVVTGYYRELLRRLDNNPSADQVVIGTYPDPEYPLVTLDNTRPDGKIHFFFGEGLERTSVDDTSIVVQDEAGNVVPTKWNFFRGDNWPNVIQIAAQEAWKPSTKYTVVLNNTIRTLQSVSPTKPFSISFTTCTPTSPGGDCPEISGPTPASPCPKLDALYSMRPMPEEEEEEPPPPAVNPVAEDSSSCAAVPMGDGGAGALVAVAFGCLAFGARRRRG